MELAGHLLQVLGTRKNGSVDVVYSPPLNMQDWTDRKQLALELEETVRYEFKRLSKS